MKNFFVILLVLVSFGVFSQTEFTLQTEDNTSSMKSVVDSMAIDSNQINLKNNDIFIEVLGASGIYSLNYQRKLIEFGKVSLKGRVGFSFLYFPDLGSDYTLSFGGAINYQFTKKSSLIVGAGQVYYSYMVYDFFEADDIKRNSEYYTYLDFSYRLSFNDKWFMRVNYSPIILYNEPGEDGAIFENWGGLSVGYSF